MPSSVSGTFIKVESRITAVEGCGRTGIAGRAELLQEIEKIIEEAKLGIQLKENGTYTYEAWDMYNSALDDIKNKLAKLKES